MTVLLVEEVVRASRALAAAGLSDMVWGHAAIRDPDGRGVWMKASGWGFEEVDADRVLLVSANGEVLSGAGGRHIEYPIHTQIISRRPDIGCTVHTHAPALSAFACLDLPLLPISHDGVLFSDPPVPRFTRTGALIATAELGDALADALGDAPACLMLNHGAVTAGPDAATAVMYAVLLERACRTQLMAMAAGDPVVWSDPDETKLKREQVWNPRQVHAGWQYLVRTAERTLSLMTEKVRITHFGHACVLAELPDGTRILFDPGAYSADFEDLAGLDAILITHEHPDHHDTERLPRLAKASPNARIVTIADGGDSVTAGGAVVRILQGEHAVVHPDLPNVRNSAYQVGDLLFHPGDSFTMPPGPVRILLLPTGGPWMKLGESADYLRAVAPEIAIPIHQAGLADVHRQLHYQVFRGLAPSGTTVHVLDHGITEAL